MQKRRLPFRTLMKVRKMHEDEARRIYERAKAEWEGAIAELKRLYDSIDNARIEIARLQVVHSGAKLTDIVEYESYIVGQKVRVQHQRETVRQLLEQLEACHEKLIESVKDRKIIDKLHEKTLREERVFKQRLEQKEIDEMVVQRSGRVNII